MKNYLKIEFIGVVGEVKWFKNKSFDEIIEISKKEFEEDSKRVLDKVIKDNLSSELIRKEYYCGYFNIKKNEGIIYSNERVRSVGFFSEDLVSELKDVDLKDEKNKELLKKVEKDVYYKILN